MSRSIISRFSLASGAGLALVLGSFAPVHAACLSSDSSNTCKTYNLASGSNIARLTYNDGNLQTNTSWQIATNPSTWINYFTNWQYSQDGTNFTNFSLGSIGTLGGNSYSTIQTSPSPISTSGFFYLRVELANDAPIGTPYDFNFISNNNGATSDGILSNDNAANQYTAFTRQFTRQGNPTTGVPAPLPVLGALGAFAYSRKIRKAIRAGS